jgi:NRPS condensation-like uncharacterized protein
MEYKAEIFDRMQLLYDKTGFNDHQLHCEMRLGSRMDEAALRKAILLTLASIPILATRYRATATRSVWESLGEGDLGRVFATADDEVAFEAERTYRISEGIGPQLRICLLRGDRSALAATMNHMVADGSGFKEYLYFLCETYSRLLRDPGYIPRAIDGDRGIGRITRAFGMGAKIRAFLAQGGDSNRTGRASFPFGADGEARPFITTRAIGREETAALKAYCRSRGATINDAALAAYYRVLARTIGPSALSSLEVPVMIDMRRHLSARSFDALCNLASTTVTRLKMRDGEGFEETMAKAKALMDGLKARSLGLGGYMKLSLLFSLFGPEGAQRLLRLGLKHPLICMTNVGELDAGRLRFEGCPVESAYLCGSIKYKPHFQMALSGFDGTITLSSNLYGSGEDRERVEAFLAEAAAELSVGR